MGAGTMIGAALAIDALERPWRGRRRGRPESAGAADERPRREPCTGSPQFLWASIAALALISRARRDSAGLRTAAKLAVAVAGAQAVARATQSWVAHRSPRRPAARLLGALGGGVGRGEACSSARREGAGPRGLQRGGARRISTPGGAAPPRGRRGPRRDGRRADRPPGRADPPGLTRQERRRAASRPQSHDPASGREQVGELPARHAPPDLACTAVFVYEVTLSTSGLREFFKRSP